MSNYVLHMPNSTINGLFQDVEAIDTENHYDDHYVRCWREQGKRGLRARQDAERIAKLHAEEEVEL